jgi:hypothetical protein
MLTLKSSVFAKAQEILVVNYLRVSSVRLKVVNVSAKAQ